MALANSISSNRYVSPPLQELDTLRTPLTSGEEKVLSIFVRNLPSEWEIYIQPHLNGLRPDFVLLNPKVGIGIFEVKDWNLETMPYWVKYSSLGYPELWATSPQGKDFKVKDNPVEKILRYKDNITELYCPRIALKSSENFNYKAIVTAGVIMTCATTQKIKNLFDPFYSSFNLGGNREKYYPLIGRDLLESNNIKNIFPPCRYHSSKYMSEDLARDLRSWLVEPDFSAEQRKPLDVDKEQLKLINSRTKSGYRRIKGSAGSGKSLVLAGRAAQLSSEGKDILVVSFNITLWHYLRDLAIRHNIPNKKIKEITWVHFHEWCKRVCFESGNENRYRELFKGIDDQETLKKVLEKELIDLVNEIIDNSASEIKTYDAILVDEGQDYNLKWWNTLRRVLRSNGEMLLVADETQDLYNRTQYWTDEAMSGAGFSGKLIRLDACYRTPTLMIQHLRNFAEYYLDEGSINLPEEPRTLELNLYPLTMRWIQDYDNNLPRLCTNLIKQAPIWFESDPLSYTDIALIVQNHKLGLECVEMIEEEGIKVVHTFGRNHQEQKLKKRSFFMGDARVKASTIHSFKGWESSVIFLVIDKVSSKEDYAGLYVALSRVKKRTEGSYITVLCSDPSLEEYGETWENYSSTEILLPSTANLEQFEEDDDDEA